MPLALKVSVAHETLRIIEASDEEAELEAIIDLIEAYEPSRPSSTSKKPYFAKGDYDRAISNFDEAIRLDANLGLTYFLRGHAKLAKGDAAGGEADIAKAKQLDPNLDKLFPRPARKMIMRT